MDPSTSKRSKIDNLDQATPEDHIETFENKEMRAEDCLDFDFSDSRLKANRDNKADRKESVKRKTTLMSKNVDFDRDTRTKTKGSLRSKLDEKVEESEAKIQELKYQLHNDKSLTSE